MKGELFRRPAMKVLLALIAMFAWGCAFPCIKLGLDAFAISSGDTGGKLVFAGLRFTIAGALTLCIARGMGQRLLPDSKRTAALLLLYGAVNTGLHYCCFYIGVSNCSGSKSSIIDSFATFELILLACLFFRERLTPLKLLGCLLGLAGIAVTELGGELGGGFRMSGEGMMLLATLCSAFGGILARVVTARHEVISATGWGLLIGGVMLLIAGTAAGGRIAQVTPEGIAILAALVTISTVAFILYNQLLRYNRVSGIAIYNALIPCFGTLMSCLLLGETFYLKYPVGIALIAMGIFAVNRDEDRRIA